MRSLHAVLILLNMFKIMTFLQNERIDGLFKGYWQILFYLFYLVLISFCISTIAYCFSQIT